MEQFIGHRVFGKVAGFGFFGTVVNDYIHRLGVQSFLANSDLVAISQECLYANHLGDASQMERDEVVRVK